VKDWLQIKSNAKIENIEIYDQIGRLVSTQKYNPKINVENLESGIYYLKINSQKKIFTQKFIKN
jgi:hypothetical protein